MQNGKYLDLIKAVESVTSGLDGLTIGSEDALGADIIENELEATAETVASQIEAIAAQEDIEIQPYQVELAKKALAVATDPIHAFKQITKNMGNPTAGLENDVVASIEGLPDYDNGDTVTPAMEAFDGLDVKPRVHFNVVFTALAAKQDEGAELLFPIVPIDPFGAGASVTATIVSVYKDALKDTSGTVINRFEKVPLIKIANDPDKIDVDKNRLVPVLRDASANVLVGELSRIEDNGVEKVTTAPIKIGTEVDILGVSQTDAMLAKGYMDPTDTLDPHVQIKNIYYTLSGKDSTGADITEYFKFDIDALGINFTQTVTGHNKDIQLNTTITGLGINTATTKPVNKEVSDILSQLPQGYTAKISIKLHGDGNTNSNDSKESYIALYVNEIKLEGIYDPSGAEVPSTADEYVQIKAVIDTLTPVGYDVDAYLINSNARLTGLLITADKYSAVFTVPFRTGFSKILPVVKTGDQSDADLLDSSLQLSYYKMNAAAYKALNNFINTMRNTTDEISIKGISNKFIDKEFIEETIDLTQIVDSLTSNARIEDLRAAILNKIRLDALNLYVNSNYAVAYDAFYRGGKPTITIVAHKTIAAFIAGEQTEFSDAIFNYKIASTVNPIMKDKIVFTFGIFDSNRNKVPNVLNFGQCFYAPDLVIPVIKTENNRVAQQVTIMNRYLHTINLPIIGLYNITNLKAVLGKQPVNFHNV